MLLMYYTEEKVDMRGETAVLPSFMADSCQVYLTTNFP